MNKGIVLPCAYVLTLTMLEVRPVILTGVGILNIFFIGNSVLVFWIYFDSYSGNAFFDDNLHIYLIVNFKK